MAGTASPLHWVRHHRSPRLDGIVFQPAADRAAHCRALAATLTEDPVDDVLRQENCGVADFSARSARQASRRSKTMSLADKTVLITAAGQGIGRASVEAFSRTGATVWATDINEVAL